MDLRELKDKASQLFAKGKFARAAEAYQEYCQADSKDLQSRLRLGDAWAKAGKKDQAITAYTWAAEGFAKEGFLPRAIAASKLVLELDPGHTGVQKTLAQLYARRSSSPVRAPKPPPAHEATLGAAPASLTEPVDPVVPLGGPGAAAGFVRSPRESEGSGAPSESAIEIEFVPGVAITPTPVPVAEVTVELDERRPTTRVASVPSGGSSAVYELKDVADEPADQGPGLGEYELEVGAASSSPAPSGQTEPVGQRPAPRPTPVFELEEVADDAPPLLLDRRREGPSAAPPKAEFTELELDDSDSLLHLVEAAAAGAATARVQEDSEFELEVEIEEARIEPGALPRIPLFSDLPSDAFIALFEGCPLRRLADGERVIEQGSLGESFYIVCSGKVRVTRDEDGQRRVLATLDEGAFFGEMALLSQSPRSASVEAIGEDTQVLEISARLLRELSARYPSVAGALKKFCRQRLLSNLMATAELFRPFNRSDRRELVQKFRAREVDQGEVLIAEGSRSDGLYVVLSGEVEVRRMATLVTRLSEGQIFGEMSLLTRSPASATVTATRHTSLLRLPREDFDLLILSHPQVLELVSYLTDERTRANQRLVLV